MVKVKNPINEKIGLVLNLPIGKNFYFCFHKTQSDYEDWQDFTKIDFLTRSDNTKRDVAYVEYFSFEEFGRVCSMVFVEKPTIDVFVHEINHMVDDFIQSYGMDASHHGTEFRSMLMQWLTREAFKFYKPKNMSE